jgi:hypothetical protein
LKFYMTDLISLTTNNVKIQVDSNDKCSSSLEVEC